MIIIPVSCIINQFVLESSLRTTEKIKSTTAEAAKMISNEEITFCPIFLRSIISHTPNMPIIVKIRIIVTNKYPTNFFID
jgi:hypothetical protein